MARDKKWWLQDEMRACCRDINNYTRTRQSVEVGTNYYKSLTEEIEKAWRQYDVAKTEYVNLYGPIGVVSCRDV